MPQPSELPLADACPLRLRGVSKRFGDFVAVDDVSLTITPGEIFALLGPNGAGKSTLIRCICGLARQSAGQVSVFGHDTLRDFRLTRRLIGLVPQEIAFDPFFTPFESLMIHMGLMGVTPDARWADALLDRFSLSDHRDAYTRHLSGGMKRRLLVAKAMVHHPRLLFLDEPTAGVDVELRKGLWVEVQRMRQELGTTVILTTHYLEEAEQLADRVGIINHGRLALVETREDLMRHHGQSRVIFTLRAPLSAPPASLPPDAILTAPRRLEVPWDGDGRALQTLLGQVHDAVEVERVDFERASLEDVFVDLIRSSPWRS